MKILLVAGHGNGDSGAVGCGCKEADLTRELVGMIDELGGGLFSVYDTKKNLYEENMRKVFTYSEWDYTLEIHFNAFKKDEVGDGKQMGSEIYVHPSKGQGFEAFLLKSVSDLGFRNRGVKSSVGVSKNVNLAAKQGAAASLLEVCFIDDRDDMTVYEQKKKQVAETIVACFCQFFNLKVGKDMKEEKNANKPKNNATDALSYDSTVDALIKKGITDRANMVHWEKCLAGSLPLVPSEVRTLFERMLAKIE